MGSFNNPVVMPREDNPWERLIPTVLTSLLLGKMQHNWQMDTAKMRIEAQKVQSQAAGSAGLMQKGWKESSGGGGQEMFGSSWDAPQHSLETKALPGGGSVYGTQGPFGFKASGSVSGTQPSYTKIKGPGGTWLMQNSKNPAEAAVDTGISVAEDLNSKLIYDGEGGVKQLILDDKQNVKKVVDITKDFGVKGVPGAQSQVAVKVAAQKQESAAEVSLKKKVKDPNFFPNIEKTVRDRFTAKGAPSDKRMNWKWDMKEPERKMEYAQEALNQVRKIYPGATIDIQSRSIVADGETIAVLPW